MDCCRDEGWPGPPGGRRNHQILPNTLHKSCAVPRAGRSRKPSSRGRRPRAERQNARAGGHGGQAPRRPARRSDLRGDGIGRRLVCHFWGRPQPRRHSDKVDHDGADVPVAPHLKARFEPQGETSPPPALTGCMPSCVSDLSVTASSSSRRPMRIKLADAIDHRRAVPEHRSGANGGTSSAGTCRRAPAGIDRHHPHFVALEEACLASSRSAPRSLDPSNQGQPGQRGGAHA